MADVRTRRDSATRAARSNGNDKTTTRRVCDDSVECRIRRTTALLHALHNTRAPPPAAAVTAATTSTTTTTAAATTSQRTHTHSSSFLVTLPPPPALRDDAHTGSDDVVAAAPAPSPQCVLRTRLQRDEAARRARVSARRKARSATHTHSAAAASRSNSSAQAATRHASKSSDNSDSDKQDDNVMTALLSPPSVRVVFAERVRQQQQQQSVRCTSSSTTATTAADAMTTRSAAVVVDKYRVPLHMAAAARQQPLHIDKDKNDRHAPSTAASLTAWLLPSPHTALLQLNEALAQRHAVRVARLQQQLRQLRQDNAATADDVWQGMLPSYVAVDCQPHVMHADMSLAYSRVARTVCDDGVVVV